MPAVEVLPRLLRAACPVIGASKASAGLVRSAASVFSAQSSSSSSSSSATVRPHTRSYTTAQPPCLVEDHGNYAVVTLNRPHTLNALSAELCQHLLSEVLRLDSTPAVAAVVITGSGRAFAAGKDIRELAGLDAEQVRVQRPVEALDGLLGVRTPLIAAVNGYALGGGCELALMCDIIVAGEGAVFGMPELQIGVIPAMGGTQMLPRLVGRPLAMDMVLTGRRLKAHEALEAGLVSRVAHDPLAVATSIAQQIAASSSLPAAARAKVALRAAERLPLPEGLREERRLFYACYDGGDQREGMEAFMGKRRPAFKEPKPKEL